MMMIDYIIPKNKTKVIDRFLQEKRDYTYISQEYVVSSVHNMNKNLLICLSYLVGLATSSFNLQYARYARCVFEEAYMRNTGHFENASVKN